MNSISRFVSYKPTRRLPALVGVFIVTLTVAACFDNEPQQRRAFISFLQTRIIDKPGLHIPIMSDKDVADFGSYADHYRVMNGFHHKLDASISKDLARTMQIGNPRSLEDLRDHRDILPVLRSGMATMKADLDKAESEADAAHKALRQPADLKAVYDVAYGRMVTTPAGVFRELGPMIESMLPAIEELAAYLDEHRDTITFRGGTPVVTNPATRTKLATLMEAAGKAAQASEEGKRKLRAMAEGK
ncbi:MAG TPA: DUF3053 family protein [Pseudolabrys sp.]|nr:DUF3053 family protein [Pseudolabrys sp.]